MWGLMKEAPHLWSNLTNFDTISQIRDLMLYALVFCAKQTLKFLKVFNQPQQTNLVSNIDEVSSIFSEKQNKRVDDCFFDLFILQKK